MYIINENLATHGLEWQWGGELTPEQVLQPDEDGRILGYTAVDVRRWLHDAPTNRKV